MPNSQSIWNALLTVLGVALLACLGWQMSEISKLKEMAAAESATEFTAIEANKLRQELTTIMTNIDLRISLLERDIEWLKTIPFKVKADWEPPSAPAGVMPEPPVPPADSPTDSPPEPKEVIPKFNIDSPRQDAKQQLRYDLRK